MSEHLEYGIKDSDYGNAKHEDVVMVEVSLPLFCFSRIGDGGFVGMCYPEDRVSPWALSIIPASLACFLVKFIWGWYNAEDYSGDESR